MITFNGIALNSSLKLQDQYNSSNQIKGNEILTLGGGRGVEELYLSGSVIVIASESDSGWENRSVVEQLYSLSIQTGAWYPLIIESNSYTVRFMHENPPAFKAVPVNPTINPSVVVYFTIEMRLMAL